jgi:hypothetical protein
MANQSGSVLLTEEEASEHLRVPARTLQWWRYAGGGPRYLKLGRLVRYRAADIESFLETSSRRSTASGVSRRYDK